MNEKASRIAIKLGLLQERVHLLETHVEIYKATLDQYTDIQDDLVELSNYKKALQAIKALNLESEELKEILKDIK